MTLEVSFGDEMKSADVRNFGNDEMVTVMDKEPFAGSLPDLADHNLTKVEETRVVGRGRNAQKTCCSASES